MKQTRRLASVMVAVAVGFACMAQADTLSDAKERRKARRAQVEQIVQAGQAEEGGDGYLVAKGALDATKAAVVKDENADRKTGYEAIAKANGKTAEEVGKQAAGIQKSRRAKR